MLQLESTLQVVLADSVLGRPLVVARLCICPVARAASLSSLDIWCRGPGRVARSCHLQKAQSARDCAALPALILPGAELSRTEHFESINAVSWL